MTMPSQTSDTHIDPDVIVARMLEHAFLSGVVAARNTPGHEEINGPALWADYKPYPLDHQRWQETWKQVRQEAQPS